MKQRSQFRKSRAVVAGFACLIIAGAAQSVLPAAANAAPRGKMPRASKPPTMVISRAQYGKTVTVKKGSTVVIRLKSSISTGYSWVPDRFNPKVLSLLISQTLPTPPATKSKGPHTGAAGVQIFRFRAIGAGPTTVRLVYKRLWDMSPQIANAFRVNVDVRG